MTLTIHVDVPDTLFAAGATAIAAGNHSTIRLFLIPPRRWAVLVTQLHALERDGYGVARVEPAMGLPAPYAPPLLLTEAATWGQSVRILITEWDDDLGDWHNAMARWEATAERYSRGLA